MWVEVLLAGATEPEPLPVHNLVDADLWDQLPADLDDLLPLLLHTDLYLQNEMQVTLFLDTLEFHDPVGFPGATPIV